jgi:RNA-binding protein
LEKIQILHKTPKGKLIGRTKKQLRLNASVGLKIKDKIKKIGKIYDIFGPVDEPYVKIIPFNEEDAMESVKVSHVFVLEEQQKTRKKGRK